MKLYFAPGACSLSPHIVLHEAGLAAETERVDLATKKTASGADFTQVNPNGYVPALQIDDGSVLTEGPAIVQYLADRKPDSKLAPANGTNERYHLQERLNFISTEIHKSYSPLFKPNTVDEAKKATIENLNRRYDFVEQLLADRQYLMGADFTVADAYLFTVTNWSRVLKLDLFSTRPNLKAYMDRVGARPAVQSAMRAEGLIK
ncbi:MAG TPA: glutathione transferase GstA [Solimonas sp.]|nr:glutathione transferase GstA [Solimonas sp.]